MNWMNAFKQAVKSAVAAAVVFSLFWVALFETIGQEMEIVGTLAIITIFTIAVLLISFTIELVLALIEAGGKKK